MNFPFFTAAELRELAGRIRDIATNNVSVLDESFRKSCWEEIGRLEGAANDIEAEKYWSERAECRMKYER